MSMLGRRDALRVIGAIGLGAIADDAFAQPNNGRGLLARLQAAKKVRVGIANQPPFSALNPDGTLTGATPTITKRIMDRLGIPEIQGFIATYGELIPGMMADRWDFVSASLTITKARCGQVRFADPVVFNGANIVAPKGHQGPMPKRLAELAKGNFVVGAPAGGADVKALLAAGVSPENIRQFTNDQSELDGLFAKRIDYAIMAPGPVRLLIKQRNIELEITYPIEDDPPRGSSCAFRPQDTDLYDAYVGELRAMRASGELADILTQYGFDASPELLSKEIDQLCTID